MATTWQEFEGEILRAFQAEYPEASILFNQKRIGRFSKTERQIDILIEGQVAGHRLSIVVDAKFYGRKVDVKGVEEFIGMMTDIGAHKGLIISQRGYTDAAISRAYNDQPDIELDILNFDDLHALQSFSAIPFSRNFAAYVQAPFGCVIDASRYEDGSPPAHIYQRGLTRMEALSRGECMYVQFSDRTIDDLIDNQNTYMMEYDSQTTFEYPPTLKRNDAPTKMRLARVPTMGDLLEYTGFVKFQHFVLFIVLLTTQEHAAKNVRKLESVMLNARPATIQNPQALLTAKEPKLAIITGDDSAASEVFDITGYAVSPRQQ